MESDQTQIQPLASAVHSARSARGLSMSALAKAAAVDIDTIRQIERGTRTAVRPGTLRKLEAGLRLAEGSLDLPISAGESEWHGRSDQQNVWPEAAATPTVPDGGVVSGQQSASTIDHGALLRVIRAQREYIAVLEEQILGAPRA